jgi:hypothetical protein
MDPELRARHVHLWQAPIRAVDRPHRDKRRKRLAKAAYRRDVVRMFNARGREWCVLNRKQRRAADREYEAALPVARWLSAVAATGGRLPENMPAHLAAEAT